ncbi:hypothetical protein G7085_08570 [Tessaracoccus sp. HDW20]|uniref:glycoside hydrolase family 3 N-terminal domain-containing protein n=1 Tax=Tessaracoccus coleopterorum TaxID=2714950 RepID=UPI0018D2F0C4|nr:hypothetical protein [Tessaracoccus coleopterorum]
MIVFMKHFIVNDQETNARSGINVWANEQALRELYLRPFEITVKEGDAKGAMSSFIHVGHKWAGGNPELLQDVLRGEWGSRASSPPMPSSAASWTTGSPCATGTT